MTTCGPEGARPDYRYRGFNPSCHQTNNLEKDHRLMSRFKQAGVERQTGAKGFAYGSEINYNNTSNSWKGHGLDNKTSAEKIKLKKQHEEAEADIQSYQQFKSRKLQEAVDEKRRDLEELQNYKPWGKPAGGAPRITASGRVDARNQPLQSENATLEHTEKPSYNPFGRPGAGAPLKTMSGKVDTSRKEDPKIRFQDHLKKEVDVSLRYKPEVLCDEVQAEKDSVFEQPEVQRTESEKLRQSKERNKKFHYAKKLEEQRIDAIERRAKERAEEQVAPSGYMWGKNIVDRDKSGKLKTRKWVLQGHDPGAGHSHGRDKFVSLAEKMKNHKDRTHINKHNENLSNLGAIDSYDPWGKPGAGAPLRNEKGEVTASSVYGKCTSDLEKRSAHEQVVADKTKAGRGYGMDAASWIRTGAVDMPKRQMNPVTGQLQMVGGNKSTSDVTALHYNVRPTCQQQEDGKCRQYFTDLQLQAEQRHKQKKEQRENEKQLERQHAEKASLMWDQKNKPKPAVFKKHPMSSGEEGESMAMARGMNRERWLAKRKDYSEELQRMIEERNKQSKMLKQNSIKEENEHMAIFNQQWGRPGAGAPRVDRYGNTDTAPKNINTLLGSHVHTGWHFRRT